MTSVGTAPDAIVRAELRVMATDVSFQIFEPSPNAGRALELAADVFRQVESACTRFDPHSPLMVANAAGQSWQAVPQLCFDALFEAARAHHETGGLFDPRVLDALVAIGYDHSLPFGRGSIELRSDPAPVPAGLPQLSPLPAAVPRWDPGFDAEGLRVRVGPRRVDLGGIGKGLAVRWAAQVLAGSGTAQLIEAGGDCYLAGPGPVGSGWRVGVENPCGAADSEPLVVLELQDLACATSSLRKRAWRVDGRPVHHLIDPGTGRSTSSGLRAVTVAGPDPAFAEVWSKSLLIAGRDAIAELARDRGLAALWVDDDADVGISELLRPHVIWEAGR